MRLGWIFAGLVLTLTACSIPRDAAPYRMVTMQASIDIQRPIDDVFSYATNPENEQNWRPEVLSFSSSGPEGEGRLLSEVIRMGLRSQFSMVAEIKELSRPNLMRVEAVASQDRGFVSERTFQRLNDDWTRLTYRAVADERVVYDITLVPLGLDEAGAYYQWIMGENLRRLKRILEAE